MNLKEPINNQDGNKENLVNNIEVIEHLKYLIKINNIKLLWVNLELSVMLESYY